jgi:hypothetical protein
MRPLVVSHIGPVTLDADILSVVISHDTLRFSRAGGLMFLRMLQTKRTQHGVHPFTIEAMTIDGPITLRFEYKEAAQMAAIVGVAYPKDDIEDGEV